MTTNEATDKILNLSFEYYNSGKLQSQFKRDLLNILDQLDIKTERDKLLIRLGESVYNACEYATLIVYKNVDGSNGNAYMGINIDDKLIKQISELK